MKGQKNFVKLYTASFLNFGENNTEDLIMTEEINFSLAPLGIHF